MGARDLEGQISFTMAGEVGCVVQEASQSRQRPATPMIFLAAAVGCAVWHVVPLAYVRPVLDKVMEELQSVDDTIRANLQQFSLVPFTEDGEEYRDAVESWSLHFNELSRMAQTALYGTVDDAALAWLPVVFYSVAVAAAVSRASDITATCSSAKRQNRLASQRAHQQRGKMWEMGKAMLSTTQ